jgi:hypothetical protein
MPSLRRSPVAVTASACASIFSASWIPPFELSRHLAELGIADQVRFHGFVEEARMGELLDEADLALNLRNPTRGEASGSLLRIWSHGLPCVVSHCGIYALIPEDAAVRIPVDDTEILALARELDGLAEDPESYYRIGYKGRDYLAAAHTPEMYVDGLLDFLPEVEAYRSRSYLEHYLPRIAHEIIAELPAPAAQNYWIDRVAGIFAEGFNASARESAK